MISSFHIQPYFDFSVIQKLDITINELTRSFGNVFNSQINVLTNRTRVTDVKMFFLTDLHGSELHITINTLMVMLLGKTDDQIYWEGDGTFNGQINVHLLKARVEHKTWDCRGAADRKFCLRLTRALKLAKMVNDSPSQEDLKIADNLKKDLLQGEFAESGAANRLLKIERWHGDRKLITIITALSLVLHHAQNYVVNSTWQPRQKSFSLSLLQGIEYSKKSFFLAGELHVLTPESKFDKEIEPILSCTRSGYLILHFKPQKIDRSEDLFYNLYTETLRLCSLLDPLTIYVDGYYLSVPKAFALS